MVTNTRESLKVRDARDQKRLHEQHRHDDGYGDEHLTCMKEADRRVKAGLCTMCNEPLGDELPKQRHAKCEKEGRYEWY